MTGTVKALVWNPFRAETPFGYYQIDDQTDQSAEELKGRPPFLLSGSRLDLSRHPTLADARAAAQADYERRVLSALTASASEPQTGRWSYSINYGPDGEENWANLITPQGDYVANIRTHHAQAIVAGLNASPVPANGQVPEGE